MNQISSSQNTIRRQDRLDGKRLRTLSLRNRLLLAFILLAIFPVLITGTVAGFISGRGLTTEAFNRLEAVSSLKENEIKTLLNVLQTSLDLVIDDQRTQQELSSVLQDNNTESQSKLDIRNEMAGFNEKTGYFTEIFLMDLDGKIVVSTDIVQEGKIQLNQDFFKQGLLGSYISPPAYEVGLSNYSIVMTQPVKNSSGKTIGVLAGRVNLSALSEIMQVQGGLGDTGETYLVSANFAALTSLRHEELSLGETYIRSEGVTVAIREKTFGTATYQNYTDTTVIGVYRWIPELQVALVAESHQAEALRTSTTVFQTTLGLIIVTVLAAVILAFIITQGITSPITALVEVADKISHGNLTLQVENTQQDEIGVLGQAFNAMTERLRNLIGTLEQRVTDRTRALTTSIEVSRRLSTILDQEHLISQVVEQVKDAFDYYHVHIYLYDGQTQELVMAGGTGDAGKAMMARGHKIQKGRGLVGRAAETEQAVFVPDTSSEEGWLPNPLLPETKSEIAVPIVLGNETLGVLDVQQNTVGGLKHEDVDLLQSIAYQVAIALKNAQTFAESRKQAEREALIGEINRKIQSTTTVEHALQTAVKELGIAFGAKDSRVMIERPSLITPEIQDGRRK